MQHLDTRPRICPAPNQGPDKTPDRAAQNRPAAEPAENRRPIPDRMKQAWARMAEGDVTAAERIFRGILQEMPTHQAAYMGLIHLARGRQDLDTAMTMLEQWFDRLRAQDAPLPPRMVLNYMEICIACARTNRVGETAEGLSLDHAGLNDRELMRMATSAERLGLTSVMLAVIDRVSRLDSLSAQAAQALMQLASRTGSEDVAGRVRAGLLDRVSAGDRAELIVAFERQAHGPVAALQAARTATGPARDGDTAALLGQALLDAAEPQLARRYLRFCRRRWPDSTPIRRLLVRACLATGCPDEARDEIATWRADTPGPVIWDAQIELAVALGDLAEIEAGLDRLQGKHSIPQLRMQVSFARGDLEQAERLVPAVGASMGRGRQVLAHFGATHVGAVLTELRLWRSLKMDRRDGAAAYYFAAREVMEEQAPRLARVTGVGDGAPQIPAQVFQYWDTPDLPPAIGQIMESWRHCGLPYRRLNKAEATAFLKERYDRDHVRAFRLANHAAEGADFLRLCLLLAEGGIYADADDRLTGPVAPLRDHGRGMLLFRESFGALANNLICARAGHPVLQIAKDFALNSLLSRENDGPWSKTGPGLLTRAVAVYLSGVDDADLSEDLLIRPEIEMRRTVCPHVRLPYKTTPRYWDNRFGATGQAIADALARAFGSPA